MMLLFLNEYRVMFLYLILSRIGLEICLIEEVEIFSSGIARIRDMCSNSHVAPKTLATLITPSTWWWCEG